MIHLSFSPKCILSIQLEHSWYKSGMAQDTWIEPNDFTAVFLNRYKLRARKTDSGIDIYADLNDSLHFASFLKKAEDFEWEFKLFFTDKRFFQITHGVKNHPSKELFFTNSDKKKNFQTIAYSKDNIQEISDEDKGKIKRTQYIKAGKIKFLFYKAVRDVILKILGKTSDVETPGMLIKFESPETIFRYIIINTANGSRKNAKIEIKCITGNVKFKTAKPTIYKNLPAWIIETSDKVMLKEKNELRLELWEKIEKSERIFSKLINKYLPVPLEYDYISPVDSDYISEIHLRI